MKNKNFKNRSKLTDAASKSKTIGNVSKDLVNLRREQDKQKSGKLVLK